MFVCLFVSSDTLIHIAASMTVISFGFLYNFHRQTILLATFITAHCSVVFWRREFLKIKMAKHCATFCVLLLDMAGNPHPNYDWHFI